MDANRSGMRKDIMTKPGVDAQEESLESERKRSKVSRSVYSRFPPAPVEGRTHGMASWVRCSAPAADAWIEG